jgi:hypothetical protein
MTTEANAFFEAHKDDPLAVKFYAAANNIPEDQYKSYLAPTKLAGGGLVSFAAGGNTAPQYKISSTPIQYQLPSISDYTNAVTQLKKTNLKPEQREFYEILKSTSLSNIKNYFDRAAQAAYDKEKPLEIILNRVANGTASAAEVAKAKQLTTELNNFRRETTKPLWDPLGHIKGQAWYKQNPELAEVFDAGTATYLSAHKDMGDLITSFNTVTKGYVPPKNNPSKEMYDRVDPRTGLPILNRNGLDAVFNAKGTTSLDAQTLRDNWNVYGWNTKSDASSALHGPAIFGLTYGPLPSQGMMGSPGYGIQGNYEAAAKSLGMDLEQYAKPARWEATPVSGGMGAATNTTPVLGQNATIYTDPDTGERYIAQYDPVKKQPVYQIDGVKLYNDIYDKTKDLYLVANATQGSGHNQKANHLAILYRGDDEGNLIPIVNPDTGQAYSKSYSAVRNATSTWYGELFSDLASFAGDLLSMPPVQMALLFASPPGTGELAKGLQTFAAEQLGTQLSKEAAAAIAKGLVNFGTNLVATKGDFEKSLISGATAGVFNYYTPTVVNNIVGLGDPVQGAKFVKDLAIAGGVTPTQAYRIIENAGVTATKNGDPNQFISQIAAQFAGAVTSNNVAKFLEGQDKKSINFFSGVAGDFANLSASALANGMSLDEAWSKYGADIIANRVQNYGESMLDELKPSKGPALPLDQVNALNPPGSEPLKDLGTGTDVIDLDIPEGYHLATDKEIKDNNLIASRLPDGTLAYIIQDEVGINPEDIPEDPYAGVTEGEIDVDPDLLDPDVGVIRPEDIPEDPYAGVTDGEITVDPDLLDPDVGVINPEDIPEDPNAGVTEGEIDVDPELLDPDVDTINPEDIPEDPNAGVTDGEIDVNADDLAGPGGVTGGGTTGGGTTGGGTTGGGGVKPPIVKPPVVPPKPAQTGSNAMALLSLLQGQQPAPAQNITPPELAKIGYFYDIGGEDIFAPAQSKNKAQEGTFRQLYSTGGTVDDLLRILRG